MRYRQTPRHLTAALAGALLVGVVSPARAQIFQPGTQPQGKPGGIVRLIPPSQSCSPCHGGFDDADDYEPYDSWRGSLMASGARDPVFRAALAIAEEDNADAADFCVRCHSPVAWLRGRSEVPAWSEETGPRFEPDEEGFLSNDLDGVACMVCHRMTDDPPDDPMAPYLANAQIFLRDNELADTRLGPYDYEDTPPPSQHATEVSTFLPKGDMCGQCHDITNPILDAVGSDGGSLGHKFPIERTFSEWRASVFGDRNQTCQDCHMPEVEEDVRAASEGIPRSYMRRHDLVGAQTWVPRALVTLVPEADETIAAAWMRTSEKAERNLRAAATVEIMDVQTDGSDIEVALRVTNLTGHKLPTGYPEGRRMWLEVAVTDAQDTLVEGSGIYDDASMMLTEDEQIRTYEVELGENGTHSFHFILNNSMLRDTRIPPEGFRPTEEMMPSGRDYTDGEGGYRHWDDATFRFRACGVGPVSIRARLRFQANTREYMEFLRDTAPDEATGENHGEIAYQAWLDHGGGEPVDMAEATYELAETPDCSSGGGCSCVIPGKEARGSSVGVWALLLGVVIVAQRKRSVRRRARATRRS